MIKKSLWFLLFMAMASSCLNEPDCFRLNNNIIGISFKQKADGTASEVEFTSITAQSPTGDEIIFAQNGNKVYLGLNYFQNNTFYYFEQAERKDTIELAYLAQAQYVSSDCGVRYVLSNLRIARHTFDSVRLITAVPKNNPSGNNIEIYFNK